MMRSKTALSIPIKDVSVFCKGQRARWEVNADLTNAVINAQWLISCLCTVAISGTSACSVFFAIKIHAIVMYFTPQISTASNSQPIFEWTQPSGTGLASKPASLAAGTLTTSAGEKAVYKPPRGSPWCSWFTLLTPGSVSMCVFTIPNGTTIDIIYDAYVENNDSTQTLTGASGMIAGNNYRWGLDAKSVTAGTNYLSVGFKRAP